jgi:hypothetical protein
LDNFRLQYNSLRDGTRAQRRDRRDLFDPDPQHSIEYYWSAQGCPAAAFATIGGNYTTLVRGEAAVDFLKRQPLGPHDMEKVAHPNAERVLRL